MTNSALGMPLYVPIPESLRYSLLLQPTGLNRMLARLRGGLLLLFLKVLIVSTVRRKITPYALKKR